ncbi:uncharacterized protein LOC143921587 [Arctopsyche grandis]|uniref:uncharacterized protein LOC143921587 n=1 Tax=Arctopsyche grandis TaxID=121162 RepID=UPI00406D83AC
MRVTCSVPLSPLGIVYRTKRRGMVWALRMNLVVVIVIETFENIPQQQTTFPKPRRHAPAVVILNSGGTPLPVEWNQNGRNTPPPLKYIERKGAKHSRKFDASTKTKFLSYASITTSIKHSRKFDASTKTKFLSYASITTSTKHSKNTIKGGTTQTTPVDPQQQASTHSTRPVDPQQQASTHSTRPVDPQQQASTHSTRPVDPQQQAQHTAPDQPPLHYADLEDQPAGRASNTLPYPETFRT